MNSLLLLAVLCILPYAAQPRPLQGLGTGSRETGLPARRQEQFQSHNLLEDVGAAALGGLQEDEDAGLNGQAEVQVLPSIFVSESVGNFSEGSPDHGQKGEASTEEPLHISEAEELAGAMLSGLQRDKLTGLDSALQASESLNFQQVEPNSPTLVFKSTVSPSQANAAYVQQGRPTQTSVAHRTPEPEDAPALALAGLQEDVDSNLEPEMPTEAHRLTEEVQVLPSIFISKAAVSLADARTDTPGDPRNRGLQRETEDVPTDDRLWVLGAVSVGREALDPLQGKTRESSQKRAMWTF